MLRATLIDSVPGTLVAREQLEQPTTFELVKPAGALGLTVPRSVLLRADHVIR